MPEKWKRITGKIPLETYEIVETYLKQNKMTKNRLVQNSIGMYILMTTGANTLSKSTPFARDFFKGIEKIVNSRDYKKKTKQLMERLARKYSEEEIMVWGKGLEDIDKTQKTLEKKHAPPGRPKIIRSRGRQKA